MSRKAATNMAVLLVFGTVSVALADANNRTDYLSSFDRRPASMMSNGRSRAVPASGSPADLALRYSFFLFDQVVIAVTDSLSVPP
jgi:hypothetical protein